jgi:putative cardiolipin synthase
MDTAITRLAEDKARAGQSGLKLLADSGEALAVRALAARSATKSLDLMYYLWHDDHTGRLLMREVVKAADRGVRVRLLIDDINPQASDALYLSLNSHPNIELRLFNPSGMRNGSPFRYLELVSRMFAMTRRMHTKAWIADGSVAIVGGRNIGDAYFDAADTNFRDLDLLLLGPAVDQTATIFEAYWRCKVARPVHLLHPKGTPKTRAAADGLAADSELLEAIGDRHSIAEFIATSQLHWTPSARVIADPPEKVSGKRRRNWLMRELLPIISATRKSLEIVSPYFIPGRKGMSVLAGLIDSGVDVSVLTNSLAATDVAAVHGAYANYRVKLLKAGVKLFELQPFDGKQEISVFGSKGASLHTKAFAIDGRIGFVGSFNFDPRSLSLNAEMGVIFQDQALVAELGRRFKRERSPETSYRLYLDKAKLRWEGAYDDGIRQFAREPEASLFRRIVARIVRHLPVESQL